MKNLKVATSLACAFFIAGCQFPQLPSLGLDNSNTSAVRDPQATLPKQVCQDYEENMALGKQKWEGKQVTLNGTISEFGEYGGTYRIKIITDVYYTKKYDDVVKKSMGLQAATVKHRETNIVDFSMPVNKANTAKFINLRKNKPISITGTMVQSGLSGVCYEETDMGTDIVNDVPVLGDKYILNVKGKVN